MVELTNLFSNVDSFIIWASGITGLSAAAIGFLLLFVCKKVASFVWTLIKLVVVVSVVIFALGMFGVM